MSEYVPWLYLGAQVLCIVLALEWKGILKLFGRSNDPEAEFLNAYRKILVSGKGGQLEVPKFRYPQIGKVVLAFIAARNCTQVAFKGSCIRIKPRHCWLSSEGRRLWENISKGSASGNAAQMIYTGMINRVITLRKLNLPAAQLSVIQLEVKLGDHMTSWQTFVDEFIRTIKADRTSFIALLLEKGTILKTVCLTRILVCFEGRAYVLKRADDKSVPDRIILSVAQFTQQELRVAQAFLENAAIG